MFTSRVYACVRVCMCASVRQPLFSDAWLPDLRARLMEFLEANVVIVPPPKVYAAFGGALSTMRLDQQDTRYDCGLTRT